MGYVSSEINRITLYKIFLQIYLLKIQKMLPENYQNWPKVQLTNEDYNYTTLLKLLHEGYGVFEQGLTSLKCKKSNTPLSIGSKFKKIQLQFMPFEGQFPFQFKGKKFVAVLTQGECKLTTECRNIDFIKTLTIYAENLQNIQDFLREILEKADPTNNENISIYENQNGHWAMSKQKKPRSLQSVIFTKNFIDSIIEDVLEFIDSEQWYTEMGIPYKRSYLLYGPPGTGKSSFAQALAGHIGFSICFVNCSDKVNDFQFNQLLNRAPKKSIILIEDVDSIFSERKNTQKNNSLTFSGFLNAIDGVRSQQGRILMMTTNYKERLDPALLRPGRVDNMYEVTYASRFQMEGLCFRFFKNEKLAKQFAAALPQGKFSMSMIQGFLLKYRKKPENILECINEILESDENVKIDKFLDEINCLEVLNDFKIQECYTLASARNLPKEILEKMIIKLDTLRQGRILETIRQDRSHYLKSSEALKQFIEQNYKDEYIQRKLNEYMQEHDAKTIYQIRDKAKEFESGNIKETQ